MSIFKSIISPMQNCDDIAVRFCKQLKVKVTETTVKKEITEHPDYPSLLSVSDALRSYKVDNLSLKTTIEQFKNFPTPFIVQVKGEISKYNLFGIINEILPDNKINWYNPEKKKNEPIFKSDFEEFFTGYVMIAEGDENSGEIEYNEKRKTEKLKDLINGSIFLSIPVIFAILSVISIISKGFSQAILPIVYATVTLIGAITGLLLLLYEVDQHNPNLQKVCHGGKRTNCGAILNSKASRIFGISWSSIGFTYFMGILLTMMLGGLTNPNILAIVAFSNLAALPYIVFSTYYQAKVARQWCPMCLTVLACLALQFFISFFGHFYQYPLTSTFLFPFSILVINSFIVFTTTHILIPVLKKLKEGKYIEQDLARLKHDRQIFQALLEKQKKISKSTEGLGITLGNPEGKLKLIKVCNPYCDPCSIAHLVIDELLENNPDLLVQVIFTATGDENDSRTFPVQHLLAIAKQGDSFITKKAMNNWYLSPNRDYNLFAQKFPMNEDLRRQLPHITAMYKWTEAEKIAYTPTLFINDYQLPENYHISDLKYFLSV